jgi:hypothetical protein
MLPYLLLVGHKNTYLIIMKTYKRKYRELDVDVKKRISQSCKNLEKSSLHKQRLSQSLKKYWQGVPSRKDDLTMDEYFGIEKNNEDVKLSNTNERE